MTVTVSHTMEMYIVNNENTLGLMVGEPNKCGFVRMNVMAVDYMKGGEPLLLNHQILAWNWREANKDDEDRFMVRLGI